MLTARGVSFGYRHDEPLFSDLNLDFLPGKLYGIVGPSGVGKSTLLGLLSGLRAPSRGQILMDGVELQPSRLVKEVAWITQSNVLIGSRTAIDNAILLALIDGESRISARRRALRQLAALGLTEAQAELRSQDLSGGEAQRLCIARALTSTRRFILADEPTSQLDRSSARLAIESLTGARQADRVVVCVTHDLDLANACDVAIELR